MNKYKDSSGWEHIPTFPLENQLRNLGKALVGFFSMHQLATHGDHSFEHPLDTPIEPVVDFPGQQMFDSASIEDVEPR